MMSGSFKIPGYPGEFEIEHEHVFNTHTNKQDYSRIVLKRLPEKCQLEKWCDTQFISYRSALLVAEKLLNVGHEAIAYTESSALNAIKGFAGLE